MRVKGASVSFEDSCQNTKSGMSISYSGGAIYIKQRKDIIRIDVEDIPFIYNAINLTLQADKIVNEETK